MRPFLSKTEYPLRPEVRHTVHRTQLGLAGLFGMTSLVALFTVGLKLSVLMTVALLATLSALWVAIFRAKGARNALAALTAQAPLAGVLLGPLLNPFIQTPYGAQWIAISSGLCATGFLASAFLTRLRGGLFSSVTTFVLSSSLALLLVYAVSWFELVPGVSLAASLFLATFALAWGTRQIEHCVARHETSTAQALLSVYRSLGLVFNRSRGQELFK